MNTSSLLWNVAKVVFLIINGVNRKVLSQVPFITGITGSIAALRNKNFSQRS